MGLSRDEFYEPQNIAIVPMGFCYPGRGSSGDLPPRPECAPLWHARLFAGMSQVRLVLLVGSYALKTYLPGGVLGAMVDALRTASYESSRFFPLVHPSPRNRYWLRSHPWFEAEVLPVLKRRVARALYTSLAS